MHLSALLNTNVRLVIELLAVATLMISLARRSRRRERMLDLEIGREVDQRIREYASINKQILSTILYYADEDCPIARKDFNDIMGPCCDRCHKRVDETWNHLIELGWLLPAKGKAGYVLSAEASRCVRFYARRSIEESFLILPRDNVFPAHARWHPHGIKE